MLYFMQMHESFFYFGIRMVIIKKIKKFISDLKKELDRIRWCKGKELWKNVLVTICTIIFFALFFMLIQYIIVLVKMIDFHSIVETIKGWF